MVGGSEGVNVGDGSSKGNGRRSMEKSVDKALGQVNRSGQR